MLFTTAALLQLLDDSYIAVAVGTQRLLLRAIRAQLNSHLDGSMSNTTRCHAVSSKPSRHASNAPHMIADDSVPSCSDLEIERAASSRGAVADDMSFMAVPRRKRRPVELSAAECWFCPAAGCSHYYKVSQDVTRVQLVA